jgi:hypothetical protein
MDASGMRSSRNAPFKAAIWSDWSQMVKLRATPMADPCKRSSLAQNEWKVPTVISSARSRPTICPTRSRISPAALFVKVMASRFSGRAPWNSNHPMRTVMTRVLPDPAPASTSTGPLIASTAERCSGFSFWTISYMAGREA